jgi:hypothetical protein
MKIGELVRSRFGRIGIVATALAALTGAGAVVAVNASADERSWQFRYRAGTSCSESTIVYDIVYTEKDEPLHQLIQIGERFNFYLPTAEGGADYNATPADITLRQVEPPRVTTKDGGTRTRYHLEMTTQSAGFVWISMVGWGVHMDFRAARCPGDPVRVASTGPR